MTSELSNTDRAQLETIVNRLEAAWNSMDGDAFAASFADDADFVNIRGEHHRGREAIAAGHNAIFRTIYAGSSVDLTLENVRLLSPEVAVVHVHSRMEAPQGPLAGRHGARFSMVVSKDSGVWQIVSFHNTSEAPLGPPR